MTKSLTGKKSNGRFFTFNIARAIKLNQPLIVIPEGEYKELMENIADLRDALKAEEHYLTSGGGLFSEYDKARRKKMPSLN